MVETIYRAEDGKEFYNFREAQEYENNKNNYHCAKCGQLINKYKPVDFEIDFYDFSDGSESNYFEGVSSLRGKLLCTQCKEKFKKLLILHNNLIKNLFDNFNLTAWDDKENKNDAKSTLLDEIVNIDDPNSMINNYIKQKEEENKIELNNDTE